MNVKIRVSTEQNDCSSADYPTVQTRMYISTSVFLCVVTKERTKTHMQVHISICFLPACMCVWKSVQQPKNNTSQAFFYFHSLSLRVFTEVSLKERQQITKEVLLSVNEYATMDLHLIVIVDKWNCPNVVRSEYLNPYSGSSQKSMWTTSSI